VNLLALSVAAMFTLLYFAASSAALSEDRQVSETARSRVKKRRPPRTLFPTTP